MKKYIIMLKHCHCNVYVTIGHQNIFIDTKTASNDAQIIIDDKKIMDKPQLFLNETTSLTKILG